jgi:hypothetical protein
MRGVRRAVRGVAAVFMSYSVRDTAVTRIGVTEDSHANNFCRGFRDVFRSRAARGVPGCWEDVAVRHFATKEGLVAPQS